MNLNRRTLLAAGAGQLVFLMSGCASAPPVIQRTYTEEVSTLLISRDAKQLVIIGEHHHYVFDAPIDLIKITDSPLKAKVTATVNPFHVALDGTITGSYRLTLPASLTDFESIGAKELGFKQETDGSWLLDSRLSGKRYVQGNTLRALRTHEKLAQTYTVTVTAEERVGQKEAERLSTPVTVASNGIFLVYFAVLAPVLIPVMFLSYEKRPSAPSLPALAK